MPAQGMPSLTLNSIDSQSLPQPGNSVEEQLVSCLKTHGDTGNGRLQCPLQDYISRAVERVIRYREEGALAQDVAAKTGLLSHDQERLGSRTHRRVRKTEFTEGKGKRKNSHQSKSPASRFPASQIEAQVATQEQAPPRCKWRELLEAPPRPPSAKKLTFLLSHYLWSEITSCGFNRAFCTNHGLLKMLQHFRKIQTAPCGG
nr:uncharacterized protein LOC129525549 [Gorilla gorilla gorilla]